MRLIDADALKNKIEQHSYPLSDRINSIENGMFLCGIYQAVDESPTVDAVPVVRGEWRVTDAYPHRVYCSVCYKTNIYNAEILEGKEYPRFCMWCGAKMEDKPCG